MYTSFHVKNFRGFEDLELNDLARINLIAGRNNVGKTALLEAIFVHCRAYDPGQILSLALSRGMDLGKVSNDTLFYNTDASLSIFIEGYDRRTGHRILRLRMVTDSEELSKVAVSLSPDQGKNGFQSASDSTQVIALDYQQEVNQKQGTQYLAFALGKEIRIVPVPMPPPFANHFVLAEGASDAQDLANRFSRMEIKGQQNLLLHALKILESRIERIFLLYIEDRPAIWADIGDIRLPVNALGNGLSRLLNFISSIAEAQGGVVLIDEIENGLHHSVLVDVWRAIAKAARDFNVQIFATTHSLEMIRAAHEAFKDEEPYDFRLHRLDRDERTGKITVVTYDEEVLEAAIEANFEVR